MECVNTQKNRLYGEDIIDGLKDENAKAFRMKCNCLPACITITYEAEIERVKYDQLGTLKSYNIPLEKYDG